LLRGFREAWWLGGGRGRVNSKRRERGVRSLMLRWRRRVVKDNRMDNRMDRMDNRMDNRQAHDLFILTNKL